MIGGISFSATSITSGLDADKPVNPRPGHQYLATDTKILYVCYESGTWVNVVPPLSDYIDMIMKEGTDLTLFSDPSKYGAPLVNTNYTPIHQFVVGDIQGFTGVQSYRVSCEIWRDQWGGTTSWYIKVNGVTKLNGSFANVDSNLWLTITDKITGELRPGDVLEFGMSRSPVSAEKVLQFKNFTIKCATPTLKHTFSLSIS